MLQHGMYSRLFERPEGLMEQMIRNVEKVIVGKREAVEQALIVLLGGGHLLIEDVPGVGKTMLVRALAATVGCTFKRIQFTPDMLPGDVTGVSVYNQKTAEFEFRPGPVIANIVLADELNRTSPKTQAALLECMEERNVTVDGVTRRLADPFMVLATQNPLEFEGTHSLPEAQLDRFMMRIRLGYPQREHEIRMLDAQETEHPIHVLKPVILKEELILLQQEVRQVYVDASMKAYIVQLAQETRADGHLQLGASPRASASLMRAAQAYAWADGRTFVIPDDIKASAVAVFAHRVQLAHEAWMAGDTQESIVQDIVRRTSIPSSDGGRPDSRREDRRRAEERGRAVR